MAPLKLETAIRALRGSLFDTAFSYPFFFSRSTLTTPQEIDGTMRLIELSQPPRTSSYLLLPELHHRPSHDTAGPQPVELFVDLVEREYLERVTNLSLGHKRQNFADVGVAAPERAVENLFARHPRE